MFDPSTWRHLADAVLVLHGAIVFGVVFGLAAVVAGHQRRPAWRWVDAAWFRLAHLATIAIVVAESWLGITCPLTTLEMAWREKAGETSYEGGFVEHWFRAVLFWQAPPWVFTLAYTAFGLAVLATWWRWPPRWRRRVDH